MWTLHFNGEVSDNINSLGGDTKHRFCSMNRNKKYILIVQITETLGTKAVNMNCGIVTCPMDKLKKFKGDNYLLSPYNIKATG